MPPRVKRLVRYAGIDVPVVDLAKRFNLDPGLVWERYSRGKRGPELVKKTTRQKNQGEHDMGGAPKPPPPPDPQFSRLIAQWNRAVFGVQ